MKNNKRDGAKPAELRLVKGSLEAAIASRASPMYDNIAQDKLTLGQLVDSLTSPLILLLFITSFFLYLLVTTLAFLA